MGSNIGCISIDSGIIINNIFSLDSNCTLIDKNSIDFNSAVGLKTIKSFTFCILDYNSVDNIDAASCNVGYCRNL